MTCRPLVTAAGPGDHQCAGAPRRLARRLGRPPSRGGRPSSRPPPPHASFRSGRVSPGCRRSCVSGWPRPHGVLQVRQRGVDARGVRGVPYRNQAAANGEASCERARRAVRGNRQRREDSTTSTIRPGGQRSSTSCGSSGRWSWQPLSAGGQGLLPATIDAFFDGYRRALEDPSYTPPDPAVVKRLRGAPQKSPSAFLSWADSLMQPLTANDEANLHTTWARVVASASRTAPEFHAGVHDVEESGLASDGDRERAHAQAPDPRRRPFSGARMTTSCWRPSRSGAFQSDSCVSVPRRSEAFRVVEGIKQIGRLQPSFVVALPGIEDFATGHS